MSAWIPRAEGPRKSIGIPRVHLGIPAKEALSVRELYVYVIDIISYLEKNIKSYSLGHNHK